MNMLKEFRKLRNMNTIFLCPKCGIYSYHRIIKIEKILDNKYKVDWKCTIDSCYNVTKIIYIIKGKNYEEYEKPKL